MLSEEKEAINNLNFIVVTDIYDNEVRINKTEIVNEYNHSVRIVLNLITKLQKENDLLNEYVKENEIYKKNLFNYAEKKDKQIDLMALAILNYDDQLVINRYKNIDEVKETFEKLAKEKGE